MLILILLHWPRISLSFKTLFLRQELLVQVVLLLLLQVSFTCYLSGCCCLYFMSFFLSLWTLYPLHLFFSGIIGLLNDLRLQNKLPSLGFLNPLIYALSRTCNTCFTDITSGGNPSCNSQGCDLNHCNNFTILLLHHHLLLLLTSSFSSFNNKVFLVHLAGILSLDLALWIMRHWQMLSTTFHLCWEERRSWIDVDERKFLQYFVFNK